LRIIFAGTPEFARTALERLHASGHTIALVLTQPDRPAGRGMKLQASSVKTYALEHAIPLAQPRSLRLDGKFPEDAALARSAIAQAQANVMVVAAYGLILPQWVLDAMGSGGFGCINIHGSLLPRWRGAAPIHRAIQAGDPETGVTIMQMDAGLDTGDMLLTASISIAHDDTTASLHDRVANLGAELIVTALDRIAAGTLAARIQPQEGVTYAHKIEKQEAPLDWSLDAQTLERRVRAFNPFPGASLTCKGETIKVWRAQAKLQLPTDTGTANPGTVLSTGPQGIAVATGQGHLMLQDLQRPGGKRLPAVEFLRGFDLVPGTCLDLTAQAH
jgi:methionyl-tRNA formyltransferase